MVGGALNVGTAWVMNRGRAVPPPALGLDAFRALPAARPLDAARLGVYVHGVAGDLAGRELGWEGLTAGDILASLPRALGTIEAPTRSTERRSV